MARLVQNSLLVIARLVQSVSLGRQLIINNQKTICTFEKYNLDDVPCSH
jgi:hypothetical protein